MGSRSWTASVKTDCPLSSIGGQVCDSVAAIRSIGRMVRIVLLHQWGLTLEVLERTYLDGMIQC